MLLNKSAFCSLFIPNSGACAVILMSNMCFVTNASYKDFRRKQYRKGKYIAKLKGLVVDKYVYNYVNYRLR